jgi:hypothetical protein
MPLQSIGAAPYENVVAGDFPRVTESAVIITGQNLTAGTVVGKITASGKLKKVDSAAVDGSQAPFGVLATATDATSADKTATVYLTGEFNINKLVFGGTDTFATHKVALRDLSIFGKTSVVL